jgi:hypothetical protein
VTSDLGGRRTAAVMVDLKFAPEAVDDAFDRAQEGAAREACG